jgi:hypothetical protein
MLELADPDPRHGVAPTPADLLAPGLASDIAWFARRFLCDHALDDDVSVSVRARTGEYFSGLGGVEVTVEVSRQAAALATALASARERRFPTYSSRAPQLRVCPA